MSTTFTFDENAVDTVVESFDGAIDQEGYVLKPGGDRATNEEGDEITKEHFAGVEQGSIIFLDDDFNTLVEHVKRRRQR